MVLGNISGLLVIDGILIVIFAWLAGNQIYTWILGKKVAKVLDNEEFKKAIHRGQIIDLRENDSFKAGHILGARNMPYTQFKMYKSSLRKDLPVYLYEQTGTIAIRAAAQLYKDGFKEIYILKTGFSKWNGKIKK